MESFLKTKENEIKTAGRQMVCPYCWNGPFTSYQYLNHHITYKDPNRKPVKKPETEAFNIREFSSKKIHSKTTAATVTNSDSKVSYPQAATLNFSISASSTGEQNNQGGNAKAANQEDAHTHYTSN